MRLSMLTLIALAAGAATASAQPAATAGWQVDAAFPGGNIILEKIEGDTAFVRQDLRDTSGNWFYFHFRVRGAAGRTLRFRFTHGHILGNRGPAVGNDGGKTWSWLGGEKLTLDPPGAPWPEQTAEFSYTFPATAEDVRFSSGIPYLESHLKAFLARHANNRALIVESLCRSQKGRDVELLRAGLLDGEPDFRVLLTARHHACEALANYVMEGILETALGPTAEGEWFRRHVEIMAVPFMDKDGVEDGDQGKNRKPHDHNRDYLQELYPSVKALKARVPAWSQGKLGVAIDLHCPWIRGGIHETIYLAGGSAARGGFARMLESLQEGPLHFTAAALRSDEAAAPAPRRMAEGLMSNSGWTGTLPGIRLATTIETPYATVGGVEVNEQAARAWGRDVARAIRAFLEP